MYDTYTPIGIRKDVVSVIHALERFLEWGGVKKDVTCLVLSGIALLNLYPHPTREQIRKEMEGNICRCTGYARIADAIQLAAERINGGK